MLISHHNFSGVYELTFDFERVLIKTNFPLVHFLLDALHLFHLADKILYFPDPLIGRFVEVHIEFFHKVEVGSMLISESCHLADFREEKDFSAGLGIF